MEKVHSPIQEQPSVVDPADGQSFENQTQLTELLPIQINEGEGSREEKRTSEEDTSSSLHDAPPLPDGASVVRYLTDASEGELYEENADPNVPLLYSEILQGFESGTEGGDESSSHQIDPAAPITSTGQARFKLHELSGRSRALLKEYFETAEAFRLPLGHPTVAFSEGQIYHLLKILTNETMSHTYTTMEKMILDALKGQPTTSQPRTDHFRLRTRPQTPARGNSSDSSFGSESGSELPRHSVSGQISDNVTSCEESDGANEMALIAASFAKPALSGPTTTSSTARPNVSSSDEVGRVALLARAPRYQRYVINPELGSPTKSLLPRKRRRLEARPVEEHQCGRNSSERSVGPGLSFQDLLIQYTIRLWSGAIFAKGISPSRPKGLLKYYAITEVRSTCAGTRGGVTNTSRQLTP